MLICIKQYFQKSQCYTKLNYKKSCCTAFSFLHRHSLTELEGKRCKRSSFLLVTQQEANIKF